MSTQAERESNLNRTLHEHRDRVAKNLIRFAIDLQERALVHDDSKFGPDEFPIYASMMDEFTEHPFGTPGYFRAKEAISEATKKHFAANRHHPEHFENGVEGMTVVDLLEMLADWKAATLNNPKKPGDMQRSLDYAVDKYKIDPQLALILWNTIHHYKL
jgi:uncharacterized protein DUF5662